MVFSGLWVSSRRHSVPSTFTLRATLLAPLLLILAALSTHETARAAVAAPEQPREQVDTSMPAATGRVIQVPAGGDFQRALDEAQFGDVIELQAGAAYVGMFTLPTKSGAGWVVVRSSAWASLPAEGQRITPAYADLMPKLLAPGGGQKALVAQAGAHHFRFVGVE